MCVCVSLCVSVCTCVHARVCMCPRTPHASTATNVFEKFVLVELRGEGEVERLLPVCVVCCTSLLRQAKGVCLPVCVSVGLSVCLTVCLSVCACVVCAVLCCAVLCCAVRCGAVRCGAVRCGAVRCGAVLCCAVLCCAVLCCVVFCCVCLCVRCVRVHVHYVVGCVRALCCVCMCCVVCVCCVIRGGAQMGGAGWRDGGSATRPALCWENSFKRSSSYRSLPRFWNLLAGAEPAKERKASSDYLDF